MIDYFQGKRYVFSNLTDITGQRFGRLVVIRHIMTNCDSNGARWLCQCDCGFQKIIYGKNLRSGHTRSCGRIQRKYRKGPKWHELEKMIAEGIVDQRLVYLEGSCFE